MNNKSTFNLVLAFFVIILMVLPLMAALNSILTDVFNKAGWYRPIALYVVPFEARMVAAAIYPFGIKSYITPGSNISAFYMVKDGAAMPVDLAWNCLGWQSVLLLFVSLVAGLRGKYSNLSRLQCIAFGLLGTLLINIFRMTFIAVGIYYVNSFFAMIVHDYFAAFVTILWLLFFWWFSYRYILVSKLQGNQSV